MNTKCLNNVLATILGNSCQTAVLKNITLDIKFHDLLFHIYLFRLGTFTIYRSIPLQAKSKKMSKQGGAKWA